MSLSVLADPLHQPLTVIRRWIWRLTASLLNYTTGTAGMWRLERMTGQYRPSIELWSSFVRANCWIFELFIVRYVKQRLPFSFQLFESEIVNVVLYVERERRKRRSSYIFLDRELIEIIVTFSARRRAHSFVQSIPLNRGSRIKILSVKMEIKKSKLELWNRSQIFTRIKKHHMYLYRKRNH